MASNETSPAQSSGKDSDRSGLLDSGLLDSGLHSGSQPGWSKGLRQLYDSVVDEPIPDDFQHLLDKLDSENS